MIEVYSREQEDKIIQMEAMCGIKCSVKEHSFYSECKGMIYVNNNEIIEVESFKEGLREEYSVTNVEQANWVKPKDNGDVESFKEGLREECSVTNVEQANWIKPRDNGTKYMY